MTGISITRTGISNKIPTRTGILPKFQVGNGIGNPPPLPSGPSHHNVSAVSSMLCSPLSLYCCTLYPRETFSFSSHLYIIFFFFLPNRPQLKYGFFLTQDLAQDTNFPILSCTLHKTLNQTFLSAVRCFVTERLYVSFLWWHTLISRETGLSFDEENKVTTKNATSRFHSNQIILNGEYFKTQIKHGKNSNQSKQHVAMLNLMFEVSFSLSKFGLTPAL